MSRSVPYIRAIGDNASWRQDQALHATIYILREIGPTGYLLKEEGESKKFKVLIGDPHVCTCPVFRKEKDVCKHISWILLKKFKVPRQNPVTWQRGLVEREINELLRGLMTRQPAARGATHQPPPATSATKRPYMEQREISSEDVCPICQDEFLVKHEPVTYCKFGCGNSVHIKCMKIWAEHQKSVGEPEIKCPMCRQDFGSYELLKEEYQNSSTRTTRAERLNQHLGSTCHKCSLSPIQGKCYKCSTCAELYLCQTCFNTDHHRHHSFVFRQKPSQRWRDVERGSGAALPQALVQNLMSRDIGDHDYDILLQLDSQESSASADIPEEFIKSLPCEKIRSPTSRLLQPGNQCRVCLRGYEMGQFIRRLPCNHKFHVDCIDAWLMHQRPTCPVDGHVVWSPAMQQQQQQQQQQQRQQQQRRRKFKDNSQPNNEVTIGELMLEIPGIGYAIGPAHRVQSANQNVLRAVDERGTVHTLSGQLTMTGSRITPTRPDWLTVNNLQANHNRLPPPGRLRLAGRPRATPPSGRIAEPRSAPGIMIGRRASEPSASSLTSPASSLTSPASSREERNRPLHRLVAMRTRSSSRERQAAPPDRRNGADSLPQDLSALYLGQSPSQNPDGGALSRPEKGISSRPRPQRMKSRPLAVETDATMRCRTELDISLTGYQVQ